MKDHHKRQSVMDEVNKKLKKSSGKPKGNMTSRKETSKFTTSNCERVAICCTATIKEDGSSWFGLTFDNKDILDNSWLVLGCYESSGNPKKPKKIFQIPWAKIADKIHLLSISNGSHFNIDLKQHGRKWYIQTKSKHDDINITKYLM